jgi:hypothetical protein
MASYRYGVKWIAENDEPLDTDPESVSGFISVLLLADLFARDPEDVARDVLLLRLDAYATPPGEYMHIRGGGEVYHYGRVEAYADPLCGKALRGVGPCNPPNREVSPNATLCPRCKKAALERIGTA